MLQDLLAITKKARNIILLHRRGGQRLDLNTSKLFKLSNRIHDNYFFTILTGPYRKRSPPKSTSTNSPVSCIFKPVVEPFFLQLTQKENTKPKCSIKT